MLLKTNNVITDFFSLSKFGSAFCFQDQFQQDSFVFEFMERFQRHRKLALSFPHRLLCNEAEINFNDICDSQINLFITHRSLSLSFVVNCILS